PYTQHTCAMGVDEVLLHDPTSANITLDMLFCNNATTTRIYTLSLHDALPISASYASWRSPASWGSSPRNGCVQRPATWRASPARSEEHTSELQSRFDLVCRLLLEKKKYRVA